MPKLRDKNGPAILPAIHPNAGTAEWYRLQLDTLLQEAHAELVIELTQALSKAPPTGFAMDAPSTTTAVQRALKQWGDKWNQKFDTLAVVIAKKFAAKNFAMTESAMRAALKKAGFTVEFKPTKHSVEAYRAVVAENVGLIKSVPSEYLTDVQAQVWQSVNRGADMGTLSQKLQKNYGVAKRRAALIARDQNAKAKAVIENARRQQLGITTAIWQHSSAGKEPRPTHVAMNGKKFDVRKGFFDKDEGEWVLPGQLINCRCTSRAVIPGLEE